MKRAAVGVLLAFLAAPIALHVGAHAVARIDPGAVRIPELTITRTGMVKHAGRAWSRKVGSILEVRLEGTPEEIGASHSVLLHEEMVKTEGVVWRLFEQKVPSFAAQALLLDVAGVAYRNLARSMSAANQRELEASALAFRPDPFSDRFGTFQRFVYLTALYDISLAYEHSPLVGCTTFTFSGQAAAGSPLLARAFDFDVDDVFDEDKAVFLVKEDGTIPFASVAWPGLVGIVSGMNRKGLAVVVHGARAGPTRTTGEPVVQELRRLLSESETTDDAIRAIGKTDPLVSHIVAVNDASGHAVAIERVPGARPFVRELGERGVVTNHLEGPSATDPKNVRVRENSSTLARRARGDELVNGLSHPATAEDAVALLRDRAGAHGTALSLGDRRAVDALIATHDVVMETATRRLWVSEAPHALGRFVAFDLERLLDDDRPDEAAHEELSPDPMLGNGQYARYRAAQPNYSGAHLN